MALHRVKRTRRAGLKFGMNSAAVDGLFLFFILKIPS